MQARRSRSALLACTALAVLSLSTGAVAQDAANGAAATGESTNLQAVVVKGKRVGRTGTVSDTPLATQTTAAEIAKKDIDSIQDLGKLTEPGVDFLKSEGGVVIRGLGGPRVTTLVDGIPLPFLSNAARAGGPSTTTNANGGGDSFDFSSLSGIDVLRGADSSRAGSGALGGALVVRTLEPEDLIGEGRDWGGVAKLTFDGEDTSFGGSAAVAKRFDNTSVLFQGGYKRGHETRNNGTVDTVGPTRTKANPADFDQNNLLFKVRHEVEGGHTIGLTAERFERDLESDLKTLQGATTSSSRVWKIGDHWGQDDTQRDRVSLDYRFLSPDADTLIDEAQASLYWQRLVKNAGSVGTRVGTYAGPWMRDNEIEENAIGLTGSATSRFDTGTLSHELTFGGNVAFFGAEQYLAGRDVCVTNPALGGCSNLHSNQADMPKIDGSRLGIYVDDRIAFGDSGFALTPGVRFDWYDYNPKLTPEYAVNPGYNPATGLPAGSDGSRFSPKLLATYQATSDIELFAQWSMAYRAPTVNELYLNFANPASGYAVLGNPNLKPETGQGFEIGANLGDDDFGGRVALFHNRYRNFIDTVRGPGTATYPIFVDSSFNRDRVEISGIEVKAHKAFENGFNVHGAFAYAYGKDTGANEFLRSVAPLKAIVGVGYEQENWGTDLSLVASAGMRDDKNAKTFDAPGYGVTNLTAWWEPEQTEGLRIQAGIYNLFDKTYYNAVGMKDVDTATPPANNNTLQPVKYY